MYSLFFKPDTKFFLKNFWNSTLKKICTSFKKYLRYVQNSFYGLAVFNSGNYSCCNQDQNASINVRIYVEAGRNQNLYKCVEKHHERSFLPVSFVSCLQALKQRQVLYKKVLNVIKKYFLNIIKILQSGYKIMWL